MNSTGIYGVVKHFVEESAKTSVIGYNGKEGVVTVTVKNISLPDETISFSEYDTDIEFQVKITKLIEIL